MSKLDKKIISGETLKELTKKGIYKIHHIRKPNIFYVGSASGVYGKKDCRIGFYRRFLIHLHKLENQKHSSPYMQNVANKYGVDGFRFTILETIDTEDRRIIIEREQHYIDLIKPQYNVSTTARCPTVPYTDERRKSASDRMKGKALSDEVYKKIRVRVSAYKKDGEFYKSFMSIKDASEDVNIHQSMISKCLSGDKKTAGGYVWKRTKDAREQGFLK